MSVCAFYINADECMNCKACMAACNDVHNLSPELHLRKVLQAEAGQWECSDGLPFPVNVFSYSLSVSCNHCESPLCVEACPRQVIAKNAGTGVVSINQDLCIGCGKCAEACPYHAPVVNTLIKKAVKCDTCFDLRKKGESPACVAACSMRCLSFYTGESIDEIREMIQRDHGKGDGVEGLGDFILVVRGRNALLPDPEIAKPNLFVTPHRKDAGLTSGEIVSRGI